MIPKTNEELIEHLINKESEIAMLLVLIKEYPNDQELGEKIRENFKYYFEEKG